MIRRDHRCCSRACGYVLARAARQAANPSYDVSHKRVRKALGPARVTPVLIAVNLLTWIRQPPTMTTGSAGKAETPCLSPDGNPAAAPLS
jgi:hypothetical protein